MIKIIIIIILIVLLFLIFKFYNSKNQQNMYGSSWRPFREINGIGPNDDNNITKSLCLKLDKLHEPFINEICKYINNVKSESENKFLIVGDVHCSIFQMFIPLKFAGILKNIKYINHKFEYELNTNLSECSTVIYCGDFNGRSSYNITVPLLIAFFDIYESVNSKYHDKIIWVFGNHDIMMWCYMNSKIRYKFGVGLFPMEIDDVLNHPDYEKMKQKFAKIIKTNNYPHTYFNNEYNFMVSHTVIPLYKLNNVITLNKNIENQLKQINDYAKKAFDTFNEKELWKILDIFYTYRPKDINLQYYAPKDDTIMFIGHDAVTAIPNYLYNEFIKRYSENTDENRKQFGKEILKHELDLNIIKRVNNMKNTIYSIDISACSGIGEALDSKNNNQLFEYGYNLSIFAIIKNDKEIKMSKIYLL